jgi:NADH-quinone oxidoreductase subunit L
VGVPLIGALLVPIVGRMSERLMKGFCVLVGLLTAGLSIKLVTDAYQAPLTAYYWIPGADVTVSLQLTGIGVYVAAIAACIGALTLVYSIKYMEPEEGEYAPTRYYFFTVLFVGAMIALALSDNFLTLYIFWEIIGFCSYALIAYYYNDPKAVRAGTKAFIVTAFGDIGLLLGIVILWTAMARIGTPTFGISATIKAALGGQIPPWALGLAAGGFLAGAIGKSAQFPLHIWLPDAMEAPTTISALIHAATLVNAGVYLCARTLPMFELVEWWPVVLIWVGAISALLTAVLALMEKDLKRVLAFSTISQLGYMMAGLGGLAIFASQFHLLNHAIFKALLFLCAGAVIHATHTKNLYEMGGLGREMKLTHVCFLIGVLALAGVPVFNGFWSKDAIFEALFVRNHTWPLIILIATALLTAAYAWRMYWLAFLGESRREDKAHGAPWQMALPLVILAGGTLVSWLYVGGFSAKLTQQLPFHAIHSVELPDFVAATLHTPLVWVAALVVVTLVALGVRWRARAPVPRLPTMWADLLTDTKLLWEWFWGLCVLLMRGVAALVRAFQTGDLNHNSLWIAVGLIAVLLMFLGWG